MAKAVKIFLILVLLTLPVLAMAEEDYCPDTPQKDDVCIDNPLGGKFITTENDGITSPEGLVVAQFRNFIAIMGILAIAFTVFSGFKLVVASNEEAISEAKTSLTWSVGGFVVSLLAFTIVSGFANIVGFDPGSREQDIIKNPNGPTKQVGGRIGHPVSCGGVTVNPGDFISVVTFVMTNFLGIVGVATVLMIIYYGFRYATAAGNDETLEQAKSGLKWSISGFAVTLLAYTIIESVRYYLLGL